MLGGFGVVDLKTFLGLGYTKQLLKSCPENWFLGDIEDP